MAKRKDPREEYVHSQNSTKEVYYFKNPDEDINVLCKEVFKKSGDIVHYPFNKDGSRKYSPKFKCFRFKGFKEGETLPVGIQKSPKYGYGFTGDLSPLMDVFAAQHEVLEVHIKKEGGVKLQGKTAVITRGAQERFWLHYRTGPRRSRDSPGRSTRIQKLSMALATFELIGKTATNFSSPHSD